MPACAVARFVYAAARLDAVLSRLADCVRPPSPVAVILRAVTLLGAAWKELTEEEKAPFEAKAAEDKERYAKECEAAGIEVKQPKEKKPPKEKKVRGPKRGGARRGLCTLPEVGAAGSCPGGGWRSF